MSVGDLPAPAGPMEAALREMTSLGVELFQTHHIQWVIRFELESDNPDVDLIRRLHRLAYRLSCLKCTRVKTIAHYVRESEMNESLQQLGKSQDDGDGFGGGGEGFPLPYTPISTSDAGRVARFYDALAEADEDDLRSYLYPPVV